MKQGRIARSTFFITDASKVLGSEEDNDGEEEILLEEEGEADELRGAERGDRRSPEPSISKGETTAAAAALLPVPRPPPLLPLSLSMRASPDSPRRREFESPPTPPQSSPLERLEGAADVGGLRNGAAKRAKNAEVGVVVGVVAAVAVVSTNAVIESDDAASALAAALRGETADRLLLPPNPPLPPDPTRGKPEPSPDATELCSSSTDCVDALLRKLENMIFFLSFDRMLAVLFFS